MSIFLRSTSGYTNKLLLEVVPIFCGEVASTSATSEVVRKDKYPKVAENGFLGVVC